MAEHPQNVRPARTADRTHNSRRHQVEAGSDDTQSITRSYRGAHGAEHMHRAEDSPFHQRSSRVGRHHAGHEERSNRW